MVYIIPVKRTSISKSNRFSKYKDIEEHPYFLLQERKKHVDDISNTQSLSSTASTATSSSGHTKQESKYNASLQSTTNLSTPSNAASASTSTSAPTTSSNGTNAEGSDGIASITGKSPSTEFEEKSSALPPSSSTVTSPMSNPDARLAQAATSKHHSSKHVRPNYRIVTRGVYPYYEIAYSNDLSSLKQNEWSYICGELMDLLPPNLGSKARLSWLLAHFTQKAVELGEANRAAHEAYDDEGDDGEAVYRYDQDTDDMHANDGHDKLEPLSPLSTTALNTPGRTRSTTAPANAKTPPIDRRNKKLKKNDSNSALNLAATVPSNNNATLTSTTNLPSSLSHSTSDGSYAVPNKRGTSNTNQTGDTSSFTNNQYRSSSSLFNNITQLAASVPVPASPRSPLSHAGVADSEDEGAAHEHRELSVKGADRDRDRDRSRDRGVAGGGWRDRAMKQPPPPPPPPRNRTTTSSSAGGMSSSEQSYNSQQRARADSVDSDDFYNETPAYTVSHPTPRNASANSNISTASANASPPTDHPSAAAAPSSNAAIVGSGTGKQMSHNRSATVALSLLGKPAIGSKPLTRNRSNSIGGASGRMPRSTSAGLESVVGSNGHERDQRHIQADGLTDQDDAGDFSDDDKVYISGRLVNRKSSANDSSAYAGHKYTSPRFAGPRRSMMYQQQANSSLPSGLATNQTVRRSDLHELTGRNAWLGSYVLLSLLFMLIRDASIRSFLLYLGILFIITYLLFQRATPFKLSILVETTSTKQSLASLPLSQLPAYKGQPGEKMQSSQPYSSSTGSGSGSTSNKPAGIPSSMSRKISPPNIQTDKSRLHSPFQGADDDSDDESMSMTSPASMRSGEGSRMINKNSISISPSSDTDDIPSNSKRGSNGLGLPGSNEEPLSAPPVADGTHSPKPVPSKQLSRTLLRNPNASDIGSHNARMPLFAITNYDLHLPFAPGKRDPKRIPFGTTIQHGSLANEEGTWCDMDASTFPVRSASYRTSKKKVPSAPALYTSIGVDVFAAPQKLSDICDRIKLPLKLKRKNPSTNAIEYSTGDEEIDGWEIDYDVDVGVPALLVIQFQIPGYDPGYMWSKKDDGEGYSIVYYYQLTDRGREEFRNNATPPVRAFKEFVQHCNMEAYHGRFKAIPRVENTNECSLHMALKKLLKTYNMKPFLTGPIPHGFIFRKGYMQIDIDVHRFCYMARKATYGFLSSLRTMVIDIAFLVEGQEEEDLPEQILGSTRVSYVNIEKFSTIEEWRKVLQKNNQLSSAL